MISFKSGSPSGLSELKELAGIIADSSKFKSALLELDERMKECLAKESKLSQEEVSQSQIAKKLYESEQASKKIQEDMAKKEQELKDLQTMLNKKEAQVFQDQKKHLEEVAAFAAMKAVKEEEISKKEMLAESKYKEALEKEVEASEIKQKFEEKYQKLLAI